MVDDVRRDLKEAELEERKIDEIHQGQKGQSGRQG